MEKQLQLWTPSQEFEDPALEGGILAEMPGEVEYAASVESAPNLDWYDGRDALPVLTEEQERHLFRKMNFLKYRANRPDALPEDLEEAKAIREHLVRANLKLLFRVLKPYDSYAQERQDLLSDGELALWRAVEKFDYSYGRRFSTFATKVIQRRLNERVEKVTKRKGVVQFVDDYPEEGDPGRAARKPRQQAEVGPDFEPLLDTLPPRERAVVRLRHGFGDTEAMSLTEVGAALNISKTRVRQLELQAYARLRQSAELIAC
jgi:RNA polymerase sigma factor (sigma-70 family)